MAGAPLCSPSAHSTWVPVTLGQNHHYHCSTVITLLCYLLCKCDATTVGDYIRMPKCWACMAPDSQLIQTACGARCHAVTPSDSPDMLSIMCHLRRDAYFSARLQHSQVAMSNSTIDAEVCHLDQYLHCRSFTLHIMQGAACSRGADLK